MVYDYVLIKFVENYSCCFLFIVLSKVFFYGGGCVYRVIYFIVFDEDRNEGIVFYR